MIFRSSHAPARRWTRQWWDSSVEVFTNSAQVKAVGLNISNGGMGLFAVANLRVGSEIEVEFQSPLSGKKNRQRGTVRHRALYLYGIEFILEDRNREEHRAGSRLGTPVLNNVNI